MSKLAFLRETSHRALSAFVRARASVQTTILRKLREEFAYSWTAAIIQGLFIVICSCWAYWEFLGLPPYPSLAIDFLGIAAAFMAVRGPSFTQIEQVVWVLIAFALFGLETRSVIQDRNQNDARQQEELWIQRVQFSNALIQNQKEFKATTAQSEAIFSKTQQAADAAINGVNTLTGGNSYLYFQLLDLQQPDPNEILVPAATKGYVRANLAPHFVGIYPLHSVLVTPYCMGWQPAIDYQDMYPTKLEMGRPRQGVVLEFPPTVKGGVLTCSLYINTSNGAYQQFVRFELDNGKWTWATRLGKFGEQRARQQFFGPGFPKDEKW